MRIGAYRPPAEPSLGCRNRTKDASKRRRGVPDNLNQLTHVYVVGHKELGLVQDGQLLFSFITLDDHLERTGWSVKPERLFSRDHTGWRQCPGGPGKQAVVNKNTSIINVIHRESNGFTKIILRSRCEELRAGSERRPARTFQTITANVIV